MVQTSPRLMSIVLTYQPEQTPQFFDEPQMVLPVPEFAGAIALTVQQLFDWLID